MTPYKTIGLTGTNASGKGEAARFFMQNGYDYISLSDFIREELKKNSIKITRDNLIIAGNQMREKFGPDILAQTAVNKITGKTVIDSIRNVKEIEYIRNHTEFILLSIDAPPEIRFRRAKKRGRYESADTLEEFIEIEKKEITEKNKSQQLKKCMNSADFKIINEGTLKEFHQKLEVFL
ncbi:MAG: AAA family ATPase [Acidobacteriota bacterium]